ncbi:mCG1044784, partial [Mus musculus]
ILNADQEISFGQDHSLGLPAAWPKLWILGKDHPRAPNQTCSSCRLAVPSRLRAGDTHTMRRTDVCHLRLVHDTCPSCSWTSFHWTLASGKMQVGELAK